jgi:hypothetical protein
MRDGQEYPFVAEGDITTIWQIALIAWFPSHRWTSHWRGARRSQIQHQTAQVSFPHRMQFEFHFYCLGTKFLRGGAMTFTQMSPFRWLMRSAGLKWKSNIWTNTWWVEAPIQSSNWAKYECFWNFMHHVDLVTVG